MPDGDSNGVQPVRCAIYTRKSSEEGLDKEFNSLDAQREAAEAYIRSQQAEGWIALAETYGDGGFTGANMERPALGRLLSGIEAGRVDCVVVYKVDRLSRSLLDFARIIGEFEKHGTTFVSVTQQFNTSTPVGRLTLHILLSFAQFEREIISERTRDKKAAAKRKGKWTGGYVPLGYDLDAHLGRLLVNPEEAERVRSIFELFTKLRSVEATVTELEQRGWTTKIWVTGKDKPHGGASFTTASLTRLLTNELYTGSVSYRGESYRGEHERIVDRRLWKRVNGILETIQATAIPKERNKNGALLKGLLHCQGCGKPMVPTYTAKGERRYRYYVCRSAGAPCSGQSVVAPAIETSVIDQLEGRARQPGGNYVRKHLKALGPAWRTSARADLIEVVRRLIERVSYDATTGGVTIRFRAGKGEAPMTLPPNEICYRLTPTPSRRCPRKRSLPSERLSPPVPRITRLMALAIRLGARIERENLDCRELARYGHVSRTRLTQILNLLTLAPDIQERLLFLSAAEKGRDAISEKQIRGLAAEYDWERQRCAFERLLPG